MTVEAYLVETLTGARGAKLDLAKSGSWEETINEASKATVTCEVADLFDIQRERWEPYTASVAVIHDDHPLLMGPILDDPTIDQKAKTATFSVGGVEDILDQRVVTDRDYRPGEHEALAKSVTALSGVSLGNIAWKVTERVQQRQQGGLPIRHGAPDEIANRERNYEGFNLSNNSAAKRIKEITEVIGGPDVHFSPEWVDDNRDRLQWVMVHGTEGQQTLPQKETFVFDATSPGGSVAAVDVKTTFQPVHRAYATGAGEGAGTLIRIAQAESWRGPMLETVFSDQQIDKPELLQAKIDALLKPKRTIQFTLEVDSSWPALHLWHVGQWHQVVWPGDRHPLVPAGVYNAIVIKRSGSFDSNKIKVEFQALEV